MEKELIAEIEKDVREVSKEPIPLRVPTDLAAQAQQFERIGIELGKRLRRAGVEAKIEAEHKIGLAHADYERQLSEETARLTRERNEMVRQATDELHRKLHDLAGLMRRHQSGSKE
jgi:hypothetical protein